jgi:DNA-binding winged helix-turn-helix (wHTH) protein
MPTALPSPARRTAPLRRFELRPNERVLLADGAPVTLGARAFDLLVALATRPGTLITKDELLAAVWEGLVVEENNLQVQVSTLRKILGQSALATIPGRGYRFTLAVTRGDGAAAEAAMDDRALAALGPDETQAPKARTNLPSRLPLLYGRSDDLAAIVALLREHQVVTITGAGGIGKTRVAQAVAKKLVAEPTIRWNLVGRARTARRWRSSLRRRTSDRGAPGRRAVHARQAQLAGARALIVLDNCDHPRDGAHRHRCCRRRECAFW